MATMEHLQVLKMFAKPNLGKQNGVLHAEANAILKVARSTQSTEGATLYQTLSPCKDCSN